MSRRSTPRRARASRKRRSGTSDTRPAGAAIAPARAQEQPAAGDAGARARRPAPAKTPAERPRAPWHPFPLSELLILIGIVAALIGASRGESGLVVLLVGVAAVTLGTLEFTLREHLSGFRSHAALLAALPTAAFHGALAIAMLALGAPSPTWVVVPLVLDVPVYLLLYRALRARFRTASHARTISAR